MTEWTFRRREAACQACGRPFADGERHASSLAVVGEVLAREDACTGCWVARSPRDDLFHWFTRHRLGKRGLQLDLGTLEALFVRLESRAESRVREMRYLLALLLVRKRRLRIDRIRREPDGETMWVHRPRRKESFRVHVFDFTAERLAELRTDLVLLLEGSDPSARESGGRATEPDSDAEVEHDPRPGAERPDDLALAAG
jgi:hypothetical protein